MPENEGGESKEACLGMTLKNTTECWTYSMNFPKRGKCYIFYQMVFDEWTGLKERKCAGLDAEKLRDCFIDLEFEVDMYADFTATDIARKLRKISEIDHSNYGCFVLCFLTYGDDGILYGNDRKFRTESIFGPFRSDVCPTLVGKPKIFLIEAFQDESMKSIGANSFVSGNNPNFIIPMNADFLVLYVAVPDSLKNSSEESKFIDVFCRELRKHGRSMELFKLLTHLNYKLSYDNEICEECKPTLWITSTLTREIKFPVL